MKKFFALLFLIAFILIVPSYTNLKHTDFVGKFDDAATDSIVSLSYQDISFGYVTSSYEVFNFGRQYPEGSNTYGNLDYSNRLVISLDYIYVIEFSARPDLFCNYIMDSLDDGSLIIDLPVDSVVVYCLLDDSPVIGYDIASGDLDGFFNSIDSYLTSTYYMVPCLRLGEIIDSYDQLTNKAVKEAAQQFLSYDLRFIPSSDDISYGIDNRGYNYAANRFYMNFYLADFTITNGGRYLDYVSSAIDQLGPFPTVPDTSFIDDPIDFIADYISWIVREIVYLTKFVSIFLRGVF